MRKDTEFQSRSSALFLPRMFTGKQPRGLKRYMDRNNDILNVGTMSSTYGTGCSNAELFGLIKFCLLDYLLQVGVRKNIVGR